MYILLFVYSYLLWGIYLSLNYGIAPPLYLLCLLFVSMKFITNYRVCSVAYLECKLRGIKRHDSLMNQFLDPIVDLRYTYHAYILTTISFIILTYNFILQDGHLSFINLFKN